MVKTKMEIKYRQFLQTDSTELRDDLMKRLQRFQIQQHIRKEEKRLNPLTQNKLKNGLKNGDSHLHVWWHSTATRMVVKC
jgi:hemerythrin-like domain-containing protein